MKWQKDQITKEHQLVAENGFYAVVPTPAGDWYAGYQRNDEPCMTDDSMEYFDTWQAGRKYCEARYKEGADDSRATERTKP